MLNRLPRPTKILLGVGAVVFVLYVAWLSNEANRQAFGELQSSTAALRASLRRQQHTLNRVEYRLASATSQLMQVLEATGGEGGAGSGGGIGDGNLFMDAANAVADALHEQRAFQQAASLWKAGQDVLAAGLDGQTALEALTARNHELLDTLKHMQDRAPGGAEQRSLQQALEAEVGGRLVDRWTLDGGVVCPSRCSRKHYLLGNKHE